MRHRFEIAARHHPFFKFPHDTFADLHDLLAACANQMMPVSVAAFRNECEPRRAIAKHELLHHAQLFEHLNRAIYRREIAPTLWQQLKDFLVRQRTGFLLQHAQDFTPRAGELFGFPTKPCVEAARVGLIDTI